MPKTVGELLRVAAMLGMVIVVPLTAMFGSSATSQLAVWIFEGPWGAKWAAARESPPPLKKQNSLLGIEGTPLDLGKEMPTGFLDSPPKNGNNTPIEGDSSVSLPGGGLAFSEKGENKEKTGPFEEWAERFCSHNQCPGNVPFGLVSEQSERIGPAENRDSGTLSSWQKECRQLGRYLEKLGATEYRLESWGRGGQMYHFQCRMRVLPEGSQWTRHFEATAPSPLEAMQSVVQEVVQWREEIGGKSATPP